MKLGVGWILGLSGQTLAYDFILHNLVLEWWGKSNREILHNYGWLMNIDEENAIIFLMANKKLSHINEAGQARMVDVGDKPITQRTAIARGSVRMKAETLVLIEQ